MHIENIEINKLHFDFKILKFNFMKSTKKLILIILFLLLIPSFIYYLTTLAEKKDSGRNINVLKEIEKHNTKFILYWTKMFEREDFYIGFGYKPFENCQFNNCYTTSNKFLLNIEKFDAIIFHGPFYDIDNHEKPTKRSKKQIYIYDNLESPLTFPKNLTTMNGFYNWTKTYRKDSDVPNTYGFYIKSKRDYKFPSKADLKKKKKLIAWFVSNCDDKSGRMQLANKISEFVEVDIYGKCGPLKCNKYEEDCYKLLEENYKFYLSFENSYCNDYVTEKLFNILEISVVPIVYGRVNYSLIAPPHSVINVEDFSSVEELVGYLKYLDKNDDEYLEYFKWKFDYFIESTFKNVCRLCAKLNSDFEPKIYKDIERWWIGSRDEPQCLTNGDLPNIIKSLS